MEALGPRVRRVGVDLARDPFVAFTSREREHVLVEQAGHAAALAARRDDHPIDVQEARVVRSKPAEVDTVVRGLGPERQHEAGDSVPVERHPMV